MTESTWQVCSLVVQYSKKDADSVKSTILSMPEASIVATNEQECKYVVLVESIDSDFLYQQVESIQHIVGVLDVSLVYYRQEEQAEDHV